MPPKKPTLPSPTGDKLQETLDAITKKFGAGSIMKMGDDRVVPVEVISSGIPILDDALGIGGFPRGRIVEIYGPESCLAADTFIHYNVRARGGERHNHKGGTIEHLYHRFNNLPRSGSGAYQRSASINAIFTAPSIDEDGRIFHNRIVAVVDTGVQECFRVVTASGETIEATRNHRFFTGDRYSKLENLSAGDVIYIHNKTPFKANFPDAIRRQRELSFLAVSTTIESIKSVGDKRTFDISMESPCNNFVADGFVVHNSGKSTIALHLVAEAQAKGLTCAYIDVEYALDPKYMRALGVNVDEILLSQPDTAEQALAIANDLAKSGTVAVIVIDSVNALVPLSQLEGEIGDANIGRRARLMSDGLSLIVSSAAKTGTILFFINQIRSKIGVIYGSSETTTGGNALRFYSSVRLDIRKRDPIKNGTEIIGNETEIKIVKNKMAPAYKSVRFDLILGQGVPKANSLFDVSVNLGIIVKAGAWFSYGGESLGQGRDKSLEFLRNNSDTYECIREDVTKALLSKEDE